MRKAREQDTPKVLSFTTSLLTSGTPASAILAVLPLAVIVLLGLSAAGCKHRSVDDYLRMGDQAMHDSKLAEAETDYQKAVDTAPNDARAHLALGKLYAFEQKTGPAQTEFMKVLELTPKDASVHAALASLYASQQQLGLAESQYRAAVVFDGTRSSYREQLADVLAKEGKNGDAEAQLRTAIGLDPKNAHAHFALANLLSTQQGHEAEAQAEYAQAKSIDPSLVPPGEASAEASPAASSTAVASAAHSAGYKIKPIDKKFLVTHDSSVYENPDSGSRVVARVHKAGYVRVTGISGDWLRIKMRSGVVGFIPIKAAM